MEKHHVPFPSGRWWRGFLRYLEGHADATPQTSSCRSWHFSGHATCLCNLPKEPKQNVIFESETTNYKLFVSADSIRFIDIHLIHLVQVSKMKKPLWFPHQKYRWKPWRRHFCPLDHCVAWRPPQRFRRRFGVEITSGCKSPLVTFQTLTFLHEVSCQVFDPTEQSHQDWAKAVSRQRFDDLLYHRFLDRFWSFPACVPPGFRRIRRIQIFLFTARWVGPVRLWTLMCLDVFEVLCKMSKNSWISISKTNCSQLWVSSLVKFCGAWILLARLHGFDGWTIFVQAHYNHP